MTARIFLLALCLGNIACDNMAVRNEQIIKETQRCHAAQMDAIQTDSGDILCSPKEARSHD